MRFPSFLVNRFTLTLSGIVLVALVWNLYVAANNGGRISGRVTTADGLPVAGASVILSRKTVTAVEKVGDTLTNAEGRFVFDHHDQYAVVLSARKPEVGTASRRTVRLWFRNQDRQIDAPLVLEP